MSEFLLQHEPLVRLLSFVGLLLVLGLAEARFPRLPRLLSQRRRWTGNLGLVLVNGLLLRLLFPVAAVGTALFAAREGWGLFQWLSWPAWLEGLLGIVILNLGIYWQHRVFHRVPLLWRLHRMHHTDLDFDLTTAVRFHPIEMVLSMLIKMALVALLGVAPAAVIVFELILNGAALFNHSNLDLPPVLDRWLRLLVVTPDMHRVHHSVIPRETHSNFGFNLSCWDRLFGSYIAQPRQGHHGMVIGLPYFRGPESQRLDLLLVQPFLRPPPAPAAPDLPDASRS